MNRHSLKVAYTSPKTPFLPIKSVPSNEQRAKQCRLERPEIRLSKIKRAHYLSSKKVGGIGLALVRLQ